MFNSTTFSSSRRRLQRAKPSGAGEQVRAISFASSPPRGAERQGIQALDGDPASGQAGAGRRKHGHGNVRPGVRHLSLLGERAGAELPSLDAHDARPRLGGRRHGREDDGWPFAATREVAVRTARPGGAQGHVEPAVRRGHDPAARPQGHEASAQDGDVAAGRSRRTRPSGRRSSRSIGGC